MAVMPRQTAFTPVSSDDLLNVFAAEIERVVGAVFGDLTNTARPLVAVRRTSTQSLTTSTDTVVVWQSFDIDNDGMWDAGTPDRLTVRTAGLWLFVSQERFVAINTTGLRAGKIMKNGTAVSTNSFASGSQAGIAVSEGNTLQITGKPQPFVVGDTIYLNAFQSSGGSLNLGTDFGSTWLAGVYLGV